MFWQNEELLLPDSLWGAYEDELTEKGLIFEASQENTKKRIHGGKSKELAEEHFCHRFAASCGRVVYFLLDPKGVFAKANSKTILSLTRGNIIILDLAGGAGAGTLSLLTTLAELIDTKQIPQLPTNIKIVNADYSTDAQELAQSLHSRIGSHLLQRGIDLIFSHTEWDATDVTQSNQLCDDVFSTAPPDTEFMILISNISGIGNAGFEGVKSSITHIMQRITNKKAFVLWIEPESGDASSIMKKAFEIVAPIKWLSALFHGIPPSFTYKWFDKIKSMPRTGGMILQRFSREY
ncbi:hypothetical protein [Ferrovibrio sp.]|uniref:hypothetical protein n=1 Tax=Ferrovibrio sp. TaxID=1917215 RepID=UPI0031201C0E